MKTKNNHGVLFLARLCACLSLALFCSRGPVQTAGGGSDTEVTGRIITADGSGKPDTRVMLIPTGYNPAFDNPATGIKIDTTKTDGVYRFTRVDSGTYNLQAVHLKEGSLLLRNNIRIGSTDITIPPDSLKKPATLVLPLPDSISKQSGYVYVPGTTYFKETNAGCDAVIFDSIPQCTLAVILFKSGKLDSAALLFSDVNIDSAGTTIVHPYSSWLRSAKIVINTTQSGAGTRSAVTHFPLCIRLNSANFDFSQALPNGQDIRFAKPIGKTVPYEIVKWDATIMQAVLWVAIDTIYPNSGSQYVMMFWGKSGVRSESNSAAVFDTSYGFAAAWHLEEERSGVGYPGLYRDATGSGANGDDYVYSTEQDGIVGNGHHFNGGDKITTNSFVTELAGGDVTVSLWVKLVSEGGVILAKGMGNVVQNTGEKQLFFSNGDTLNTANGLKPSFECKGGGYAFSDRDIALNEWHYLVFRWSYEFGTTSFFIDSMQTGITTTYGAAALDNPQDKLTIGFDGIRYLDGYLDEIHVSKVSRPSDWIRLSYENQKLDQTVVTVGK